MRHLDRAIPLAVKARMETEWGAISITTITKIMGETDVDHRQISQPDLKRPRTKQQYKRVRQSIKSSQRSGSLRCRRKTRKLWLMPNG